MKSNGYNMELKKNPTADLSKKRPLFLSIGLMISLLCVTLAFEWKTYERSLSDLGKLDDEFEEQLEIPLTQQPPPPPPPVVIPPEIIEIPDEEEIEEEVIDLDMEISEELVLEDVVYEEEPEEKIDQIFQVVEEPANMIGGKGALYSYFKKNLRYPKQAKRIGLEGKVYLRFVVEKNGTISNVEVRRGIGGGCDEEAIRVMKECPIKWSPGKQRGRAVRTFFTLPIFFKLK